MLLLQILLWYNFAYKLCLQFFHEWQSTAHMHHEKQVVCEKHGNIGRWLSMEHCWYNDIIKSKVVESATAPPKILIRHAHNNFKAVNSYNCLVINKWQDLQNLYLPQAICVTSLPDNSKTCRGTISLFVDPCPNCPYDPAPKVNTRPS